jgi:hypothetical protein
VIWGRSPVFVQPDNDRLLPQLAIRECFAWGGAIREAAGMDKWHPREDLETLVDALDLAEVGPVSSAFDHSLNLL